MKSRTAPKLDEPLGRVGSHEQEAGPLTSPSCPDSAPANPSSRFKGRYSPLTPVLGDGSADHGDKHTGHVRKTVRDT